MLLIARNAQLVYQYGYGYDGGRRWRKDYLQNQWTRYPCGVACSAGELVEEQSDLTGVTWTTVGQQLGIGSGCSSMLLRRNSENHHNDLLGSNPVISDANSKVLSSNLCDYFRTQRYSSGAAVSQWRFDDHYNSEEGLIANCFIITDRVIPLFAICQVRNDCRRVGQLRRPPLPMWNCNSKYHRHVCHTLCPSGVRLCCCSYGSLIALCTDGGETDGGIQFFQSLSKI